jgi:hypothetical protein
MHLCMIQIEIQTNQIQTIKMSETPCIYVFIKIGVVYFHFIIIFNQNLINILNNYPLPFRSGEVGISRRIGIADLITNDRKEQIS